MPYWEFWESAVPWDLRAERAALLARIVADLTEPARSAAPTGAPGDPAVGVTTPEVVLHALIADQSDADRIAAQLTDQPIVGSNGSSTAAPIDAVLIAISMAAPPGPMMSILHRIPHTPVVVWAVHVDDRLNPQFSHTDITTQGATVGGPLLTNVLVREGRPFDIRMGPASRIEVARAALRPAIAAGRLRAGVIARVGTTLPGYLSVDADDEQLTQRLGLRIAHITPTEVRDRALACPTDRVAAAMHDVASQFDVASDVDPGGFERSVRVLLALADLTRESGLIGGAFNCHVPEIRFGPELGITPCLALGESTTAGVPWTCTGDVVTAIAMATVQALELPTLYHEIEAVDYDADEVILANSGEHDRRLCAGRPAMVPNTWFTGDARTAPCALFTVPAGPAGLVAFTQRVDGTARFIAADGRTTGRRSPQTGTVNAGFRFASGPVTQAWPRWAEAGANHHSALTCAAIAADIERIADHLGAEFRSA